MRTVLGGGLNNTSDDHENATKNDGPSSTKVIGDVWNEGKRDDGA